MNLIRTILVLLIFSSLLFAQNLPDLEKDYYATLAKFKQQQSKLDSLNERLARSATEIDNEKSQNKVNRDKLEKLMARALSLSTEIEEQQKSMEELQRSLAFKRDILSEKYTAMLDSMRAIEQSQRFTGSKHELQRRIRNIAEKRIIILPVTQSFSFDPQKIQSIQLNKAENDLEKEILTDYLQNASAEVDEWISSLQKAKLELEDMILLQEKTDEFLQDVDTEGVIGVLPAAEQNATLESADARELNFASILSEKSGVISLQIQAYLSLANQLDFKDSSLPTKTTATDLGVESRNLSLHEYLKLLKHVEDLLKQYGTILAQKLGNTE